MAIASLVLGIISIILGIVPACGIIAVVPAGVGLILGIVDLVKKSKVKESKKAMSIVGIVLSILAVIFVFVWSFVIIALSATPEFQNDINEINSDVMTQIESDIQE